MNALESMIKTLSRLPGVGTKSATRIAYFLLKTDRRFTESLAEQIRTLKDKMKRCSVCGAYSETDPCPVCTDESRERRMMCVVEESVDVTTIEATGAYRGPYHVLHGTIAPLDGVGPEDLPIAGLLSRMESEQTEELVIAT
ncbi:MAG: toprim domain-containing protein, partial [Spirochaetales bacterium]|nr:toprim domain-containing protein [Spirochaetales bacterium]MCF7939774.1 toprim domain-containing protein [Spirochaetales bacterium]